MQEYTAGQAQALFAQGLLLLDQGDSEAAGRVFEQAIAQQPAFAEAHANRAYVHALHKDFRLAETHYRQALALDPTQAMVHRNLGALLALQKRHAEAEQCYAAALAWEPESSATWANLGALNLNLQRNERAEDCLRHAIALDPGNTKAHINLAYLQLRRGHYEEGWQLLESRDEPQRLAQQLAAPRWLGESLQGKALWVVAEAGLGDTIQFCRYIPWLKAQGARHIALLCAPSLQALMGGLQGLDRVAPLSPSPASVNADFWMPLLSAPYHAATRVDCIPGALPYLQADPARVQVWRSRLPPQAGLRVGLVWKGNPDFENDRDRSLPHLQTLAPLWRVPGVQFISLQKGSGAAEPALCQARQPLVDLSDGIADFADTAAIVQQLDLVIAVDTATAHLAGALGTPCWLMLPWYMADWRWGETGTHSPWYPGVMRLFRQPADGDWSSVVEALYGALRALAKTP